MHNQGWFGQVSEGSLGVLPRFSAPDCLIPRTRPAPATAPGRGRGKREGRTAPLAAACAGMMTVIAGEPGNGRGPGVRAAAGRVRAAPNRTASQGLRLAHRTGLKVNPPNRGQLIVLKALFQVLHSFCG